MDAQSVVPAALASSLRLRPFAARSLPPSAVGDPASHRFFARPRLGVVGRLDGRRGRFVVDQQPALYLHEYVDNGRRIRGLVGLLPITERAHDPGAATVLPHEAVHPRQVDELADRMQAVGIQPAPILIAVQDVAGLPAFLTELAAAPAVRQFVDHSGQRHRIWTIRDEATIARAGDLLQGGRGVIADGHHRYAASHRLQVRSPGGIYDDAFVMLVDQDDTPFTIDPIHRILPRVRLEDLRAAARAINASFEFRPSLTRPREFETVVTDGEQWAVLREQTGRTAVEWLHDRVLPALPRGPWDILFARTTTDAMQERQRRGGVALLLPAPEFEDVQRIAFQGRTLPEKATSFQPKPHVGPLMRSLRD